MKTSSAHSMVSSISCSSETSLMEYPRALVVRTGVLGAKAEAEVAAARMMRALENMMEKVGIESRAVNGAKLWSLGESTMFFA